MGGTIVDMSSIRSAVLGVATVALASVAAYLGVILVLGTGDAVGNVLKVIGMAWLRSSRWSQEPFLPERQP